MNHLFFKWGRVLTTVAAIAVLIVMALTVMPVRYLMWDGSYDYFYGFFGAERHVDDAAVEGILFTLKVFLAAILIRLLTSTVCALFYRRTVAVFTRDLDPAGFLLAQRGMMESMERRPALSHTMSGFAVLLNQACALAELGRTVEAGELILPVLYDRSARAPRAAQAYFKARLAMLRLSLLEGRANDARRCLEEMEDASGALRSAVRTRAADDALGLLEEARAVMALENGDTTETIGVFSRRLTASGHRLEQVRCSCYLAAAWAREGDRDRAREVLAALPKGAEALCCVSRTRQRCGL